MSDHRLPAEVAEALAQLDGSTQSFDVLSGAVFKALARTNALGARLDRVDRVVEHVQRLDELMSAVARRLRTLEAQPEPIGADEGKETSLPPLKVNRRGRPKGVKNRKTILRERLAELTAA